MFLRRIRNGFAVFLGCLMIAAAFAAGSEFLGAWTGTWEGAGSGGSFKITLTDSEGKLGGKVDVGQDTGDYTATFSTASLEGGTFKARYEYTPDPQAEIILEGTFAGNEGKGTWAMVQKGGNEPFFTGTWQVTRKD